jgi:hypothetical protein
MNAINSVAACAVSMGIAVHFVYFALGVCASLLIAGWRK